MQPEMLASIVAQAVQPLITEARAARVLAAHQSTEMVQLRQEVVTLRERCTVLETRAPVPGPPGRDGVDGRDGINGKDGASLTYCGVWDASRRYHLNDVVTHNGSAWHCHAAEASTTRPETDDGAREWKLMVKRGDRGRDSRESVTR